MIVSIHKVVIRKVFFFIVAVVFISSLANSTLMAAAIFIPTNQIMQEDSPRYFVISIGINNYQDPFWPVLKWPASDATRMADSIGKNTLYRIEKYLFINEFATLSRIQQSLQEISQEVGENDVVILYISGHGTLAQNNNGDLERVVVLHDSTIKKMLTSGLSHSVLYQWLNSTNAKRKLAIFATCHSGEGKSKLPLEVTQLISTHKGKIPSLSKASEGSLILAAAAKGEAARESDQLQGDIYTHYLLEALGAYDRNRDGMVTALEAHDYARQRTWAFTKGKQRPTALAKFIGDADIALMGKRNRRGLPVLEAYDQRLNGFFIQVDQGVKGRLPFAFPLDPNGSIVALYSPDTSTPLARYRVNISEGQTISLQQMMRSRPLSAGISLPELQPDTPSKS